jgi:hypothetical protein
MKLKHKVMTVLYVDCADLEQLVYKTYNVTNGQYDFIADEEGYESIHLFSVKKNKLSDYDVTDIEEWKVGEGFSAFITHKLLNDMCDKGVLDEGDYIIKC